MRLGAHESVAGGLHLGLSRGVADGCEAVQIFTKNASTWREPVLDATKIKKFKEAAKNFDANCIFSHTSYLINFGASADELREKSIAAMAAELLRCDSLGIPYAVMHPGAHLGDGEATGVARIASAMNELHARTEGVSCKVLLENTAGQGTCVGHEWAHLRDILSMLKAPERVGVCFDTQHAFAAGNNLTTDEGYAATFDTIESMFGLKKIMAFHLNDSKKALASRVDRHESIGKGLIGEGVFRRLVQDARFAAIPASLETPPVDGDFPYRDEIALLKSFR